MARGQTAGPTRPTQQHATRTSARVLYDLRISSSEAVLGTSKMAYKSGLDICVRARSRYASQTSSPAAAGTQGTHTQAQQHGTPGRRPQKPHSNRWHAVRQPVPYSRSGQIARLVGETLTSGVQGCCFTRGTLQAMRRGCHKEYKKKRVSQRGRTPSKQASGTLWCGKRVQHKQGTGEQGAGYMCTHRHKAKRGGWKGAVIQG